MTRCARRLVEQQPEQPARCGPQLQRSTEHEQQRGFSLRPGHPPSLGRARGPCENV